MSNSKFTLRGCGDSLSPALLCDAAWYGTLAAVRDLGQRGVPVTLASSDAFAPARWSRYVTSYVRCPPKSDTSAFVAWLLAFGEERPGHVLYPTSDDVAWLIACNAEKLTARYRLYSPPPGALASILDKGKLAQAAQAVGLPTPKTWLPENDQEFEEVARVASFPAIVKPRTQVFGTGCQKGDLVTTPDELLAACRLFSAARDRDGGLATAMSGSGMPLIQACYLESERIYTVDGFVDRGGEIVTLGCNKLLQKPRRRGPGIIFDDAPVPPEIAAGLQRLWRHIGFFGVFDAEFVLDEGRPLLIDVNPRFYNHMALEIVRQMPLPWMAYLAASGETAGLQGVMRAIRDAGDSRRRLYVHRFPTSLMLLAQRITGNMTAAECAAWKRLIAEHAGAITDPTIDRRDMLPAILDVVYHVQQFVMHPRSFILGFAADRDRGRKEHEREAGRLQRELHDPEQAA